MANHTVNITTEWDSELDDMKVIFTPSSTTLESGDTLTFQWDLHSGGAEPTHLLVSGFDVLAWDPNNNNIQLNDDNSAGQSKTVKVTLPDISDVINVATVGGTSGFTGSKNFTAHVSDGIDRDPDQIDLGSVTNANPNSLYYADAVQLTGVSVGENFTASVSGSGEISRDNISWTTGTLTSLQLNDWVYTRNSAANGYDTLETINMAIRHSVTGTVNFTIDDFPITTKIDPALGSVIEFGHLTGPIPLTDLRLFFGALNLFDPVKLSDYLRGGAFVPDLTNIGRNTNIADSLPLSLLSFRNAATTFYFEEDPANYWSGPINTSNNPVTSYEHGWDLGTDFEMGFGAGMNEGSEFKHEFRERKVINSSGVTSDDTDVDFIGGNPAIWDSDNNNLLIGLEVPGNIEREYYGTIRFHARNILDTSVEIFTDVDYRWFFYGP